MDTKHVHVSDVAVSLIGPGDTHGDITIGEGNLGLVLAAGETTLVVEGAILDLHQAVWDGFMVPLPQSFLRSLPVTDMPLDVEAAAESDGN